ncbi:MAG TPA: hypothetical protein VFF73_13315 [Planctomycetota bacterium]|nr:hypothetical protein [Planctomycetota bacterium]
MVSETSQAGAVAVSPSGEFVASVTTQGDAIRIWQVSDKATAAVLPCPFPVMSMAFSPDARWLAASLVDGREVVTKNGARSFEPTAASRRIYLWSLRDRGVTRLIFPDGKSPTNCPIAFTADGDMVALLSSGTSGTLVARHTKNDEITLPLGPHPCVRDFEPCHFRATFSGDASVVAVGREDKEGALELWSLEGRRLVTLEEHARCDAFAISSELVAGAIPPATIRLWSRKTGELVGDIESPDRTWTLAFSPAGDVLAAAGLGGVVHVYDVATRSVRATLQGHDGSVRALAFSPKGDELVSASSDGTVRVWSLEDN